MLTRGKGELMESENGEKVTIELGPIEIARLSSANLQVISERGPFKLREILIPHEVGKRFLITDIKVGKNSQFITCGAVPASFFSEKHHQANFVFDTMPRGSMITISATNIAMVPLPDKPQQPSPPKDKFALRSFIRKIFGAAHPCSVHDLAMKVLTSPKSSDSFSAVLTGELDDRQKKGGSLREHWRRYFMGLGHMVVRPNSTALLRIQTQVCFCPDLLVVPAEVGEVLTVKKVRAVGKDVLTENLEVRETQISSSYPLNREKMQCSDWFSIEVENKTDVSRAFYGTVVGDLVW
jgi:hypothetical protein